MIGVPHFNFFVTTVTISDPIDRPHRFDLSGSHKATVLCENVLVLLRVRDLLAILLLNILGNTVIQLSLKGVCKAMLQHGT
jgi:hypothetical protein